MRIVVINVNTSRSMTESIGQAARHWASPGTEILAIQPDYGAEAVDAIFESYIAAVGVIDRVVTLNEPFDAVVIAGFGEPGRDALQELIERVAHAAIQRGKPLTTSGSTPVYRREMLRLYTRRALEEVWDGRAHSVDGND